MRWRRLLLIDEAAQLGALEELRTAVTLMRGYGVKCWSFWQDVSQLQRIYPFDWRSLVNNCSVQQYFGLGTPQAAAEVDAYLAGAAPKPIGDLKDDESLLIRRGHRPAIVRRPDYLRDREFRGLFRPNPFYDAEASPDMKDERGAAKGTSNVIRFPDVEER